MTFQSLSTKIFVMQNTFFQLILGAGLVVKGVLILLLLFSVISWAIIFFKLFHIWRARSENDSFYAAFRSTRNTAKLAEKSMELQIGPTSNVYRAAYAEYEGRDRQEIRRMLRRFETLEIEKLERYLSFLATTGSTTPFIGLFGTVWGIMDAFKGIGASGSASLAVVAPGIAEALVTTAVGLAAAIPAVIAYNYYVGRIRHIVVLMQDFSESILDVLAPGN